METEADEPIFVLVSPHKFYNNKYVQFVEKHGPLILTIQLLGCIIAFYFICKENIWHWYLPPFAFYSFVYLFGRSLTGKLFITVQIILAHLFIPCSYYLAILTSINYKFLTGFVPLTFAVYFSLLIYAVVLQIVHRRHYTNDLSTPKSVSSLNNRDFCAAVLWVTSFTTKVPISVALYYLFPSYIHHSPLNHPELIYEVTTWISCISLVSGLALVGVSICCYFHFNYMRKSNKTTNDAIQYDVDGRAWHCYYLKATPIELIGEHYEAIMNSETDSDSSIDSSEERLELSMELRQKRSRVHFTDSKDQSFQIDSLTQSLKKRARLTRRK
uniref:Uncharacterized protein n=1 Tax=Panagrellus redivivus TaxID=6233 RepID=A0A7E4VN40_PANRE